MKKLIKQIICSLMVIVAVVGLTTGGANAQPFLNPNSVLLVTSNDETYADCVIDQLYSNPDNPHTFYSCSPAGLVLLQCPEELVFDVTIQRCDLPEKEFVTESKS